MQDKKSPRTKKERQMSFLFFTFKKSKIPTLFNEYCNAKEELYKENDENSIAKRYFGTD